MQTWMKPKTASLIALFALTFVGGFLEERFKRQPDVQGGLVLGSAIVLTLLIFLWVYFDSAERNYRRSALLNIGIVAFAPVFTFIYLIKSRPTGARLKAAGWFGVSALSYVLLSLAGSYCARFVRF